MNLRESLDLVTELDAAGFQARSVAGIETWVVEVTGRSSDGPVLPPGFSAEDIERARVAWHLSSPAQAQGLIDAIRRA